MWREAKIKADGDDDKCGKILIRLTVQLDWTLLYKFSRGFMS